MTLTEELMQAALTAPEERKAAAIRVLRGDPVHEQSAARGDTVERFLTLKECARRLGVSACSLWRWQVPGHELGGRRKFRMTEIEAYLASPEFQRRAAELRADEQEKRGRATGGQ